MYWNKNLEDYFEGLYRKIRKIPPDQISETESQSLTSSGKFKNGGHGVKSDEKDIVCPFSFDHCIVCTFSFDHCIVCAFSFDHCIVCTFSFDHCIVQR
jgi:hypothetical protein